MTRHRYSHYDDPSLVRRLSDVACTIHEATADLLALIGEVDARHLFLGMGYNSMKAYCVGELHFSEEAARKRVHAARVARAFPALLEAIGAGRLHLTAVRMLSPRLTTANVDELIAAASYQSVEAIEMFLASRFPVAEALRFDGGVTVQVVVPQPPDDEGRATGRALEAVVPEATALDLPAAGAAAASASTPPPTPPQKRARVQPLSANRVMIEVSIPKSTHDKLRRAQDLLSHAIPTGDLAEVLDRALEALLEKIEKRKLGSTARRPRPAPPETARRSVPTNVRRLVWIRDKGRCAFIGEQGMRCSATRFLELDHIKPVAMGGTSRVDNLRLLCREHNQYEAERRFGREFMDEKRQAAFRARRRPASDSAASPAHPGEATATESKPSAPLDPLAETHEPGEHRDEIATRLPLPTAVRTEPREGKSILDPR